MNTRNATPNDENLPGIPFRDRFGRVFADLVTERGRTGSRNPQWTVRWLASTGSTNDDLQDAARSGAGDRVVLIADHQTAGRGRLDRRWEAVPGANLLMSVLFRSVPSNPHILTHAVALAAASACENVVAEMGVDVRLDLKWPNDLLVHGRKVAGILATASPGFVIVGLGLNVQWAPAEGIALADLFDDAVVDIHRDDVLADTLVNLDALLAEDPLVVHEMYRQRLGTIGREVQVELPSGEILRGRALGVGIDGRLEVLDECAITHHIGVADVVHLRSNAAGSQDETPPLA